jgi:hypothetical protein
MSMFSWFTTKFTGLTAAKSGTGPMVDTKARPTAGDKLPASQVPGRKSERLEHRELLYTVVHDAMIRAGVLAAAYKFKVLSLDARGLQYMIMMDLIHQPVGGAHRLAEIEAMMAQAAKARHDMVITAVYWRVREPHMAGVPNPAPMSGTEPAKTPQPPRPLNVSATSPSAVNKTHSYEPLQQDEVDAFKRALASAAKAAPKTVPGRSVTSGRRNPAPPADFEDTQISPQDDHVSPLSVTQYGDLN